MRHAAVAVALVLHAACGAGAEGQGDGDGFQSIRRLVTASARTGSFSGAVMLAHCDTILLESYAGVADRERQTRVSSQTRFRVASMTKMLTGVAVMQLVQAGKLALSDTIARVVPELPDEPFGRITVHELLTHTAGMGSIWTPEFFARGPRAFARTADFLPLFVRDTLLFPPGARWAYSNAGYVLLGLAIERVSGLSYADYVRERIFRPTGMSTEPADEIDRADPHRAIAYSRGRSAEDVGLRRMMPAGGAVLTARDLHRFGVALLRHALLDSATTTSAMSGKVEYRAGAWYGYGFANEIVKGTRIVFHDGGADGISTNLDLLPERGLVAIVLANLDPPAARPIRDALRAEMMSARWAALPACR